MDVFRELFAGLPRQGPGAPLYTRHAAGVVGLADRESSRVLELGCGSGAATLVLAGEYPASVLAIDLDPDQLARLDAAAHAQPLRGAIETRAADITTLPTSIEEGAYHAVWSEGAAYIVGFDTAAAAWRRYLRPGGWIVLSELSWLTDAPPAEARDYWQAMYPGMRSIAANGHALQSAGYGVPEPAVVRADGMWDHYYGPLAERVVAMREALGDDPTAAGALDGLQAEIDLYRAYGDAYSYVFYLGQVAG